MPLAHDAHDSRGHDSPDDCVNQDDSPERNSSGDDSPVTPMCVPMQASGDINDASDGDRLALGDVPTMEHASWQSDMAAELRGRGLRVFAPRIPPPTQVS